MKLTILTICAVSALLTSALAQQTAQYDPFAADQKKVEQICEQLRAAVARGQIDVIQSLTADDFIMVDPSGKILTRYQEIASVQAGEVKIESLTYSDTKVKIYIGAAMVAGQAVMKAKSKDQDLSGDYRFVDFYEIRTGVWKLTYRQLTLIKKDKEK